MTTKAKPMSPSEEAASPPKRPREFTKEPSVGGVFDEDGTCVQEGGIPEPDEHRMKKPER